MRNFIIVAVLAGLVWLSWPFLTGGTEVDVTQSATIDAPAEDIIAVLTDFPRLTSEMTDWAQDEGVSFAFSELQGAVGAQADILFADEGNGVDSITFRVIDISRSSVTYEAPSLDIVNVPVQALLTPEGDKTLLVISATHDLDGVPAKRFMASALNVLYDEMFKTWISAVNIHVAATN